MRTSQVPLMYFEYNTLTVGEEYLRHNRKKVWLPVESSKKLRHFAGFMIKLRHYVQG